MIGREASDALRNEHGRERDPVIRKSTGADTLLWLMFAGETGLFGFNIVASVSDGNEKTGF